MKKTNEYEVKLDLFEGPLDLLLYLVHKSEVDIIDISVAEVSKQYLEYLDIMRDLNINIASEYLFMAATLVRLKAQELLPEQEKEILEEEEGVFNRQQLIEKLLEYKKYKEAAGTLKIYEAEHIGSFSRGKHEEIEINLDRDDTLLSTVNVFDLITAFKRVLERAKEEGAYSPQVIQRDDVKLDDRIEFVLCAVEDRKEVPFEDLFKDNYRKIALVVTFMAILELVKMGKITFRQEKQFGALYVRKSKTIRKRE